MLRSSLASALGAAMLALAVPAIGATVPDPVAIFAANHAASGGAAWNRIAEIVERGSLRGAQQTGTYVTYTDTRTGYSKSIARIDGTTSGSGDDRRGPWYETNAIVQSTTALDAQRTARAQAYVARNGWWHPRSDPATFSYVGRKSLSGRVCDVVDVTPANADPLEVWIDAQTHLIAKVVDTTDTGSKIVAAFAHYRPIDGVQYPYESISGNGNPRFDLRSRVRSVTFLSSVVAADFARPHTQLRGTLAGGRPTTVPFALSTETDGWIVVRATIDGKGPVNLVFDTGGANILTPAVAKRLGLTMQGRIPVGGTGAHVVTAAIAKVGAVQLGGATLSDQRFIVLPLPPSIVGARHDLPIDGLLGFEMLKNFAVTIDYASRRMTLASLHGFTYQGSGTAVHFTTDGHTPFIPATLDGVPGTFQLDTGNHGGLIAFGAFLAAHPSAKPTGTTIALTEPGGIGGTSRETFARARTLQIGPYTVASPPIAITTATRGAFASKTLAGNIGSQILSRFTLTIDYPHNVVFFQPNARFGTPLRGVRLGFAPEQTAAGAIAVLSVATGTPAAAAGLQAGDRIVAANGISMRGMGLEDLELLLRHADRATLQIARAGKPLTIAFPLRDLTP